MDFMNLKNSVTKTTSAFFEPALDYIVCKIPRWDLGISLMEFPIRLEAV
jgi:carbamoylphosphate synthase large subunit